MNLSSFMNRDCGLWWLPWLVFPLIAALVLAADKAGEPVADGSIPAPKAHLLSPHLNAAIRSSLPNIVPSSSPDTKAPEAADTANVIFLDPMIVTDERPLAAADWDMRSFTIV